MKKVWLLFRVQLSAILGLNRVRHIKDKKERRKKTAGKVGFLLCMLCLLPVDVLYSYLMAAGLKSVGALSAFPAVLLAITCFMTLLTSIPGANGVLYQFKDYEQVMSLPVSQQSIATSRLMLVYIYNLLFASLMLPAGGVYAWLARPDWPFYPIFLITWVFAPVLPMMVGCAIGALVSWGASRFKGSKYVGMALSSIFSLAIIYFSSSMGDNMELVLLDFAQTLSSLAQRIYPLTGLYMRAINQYDLLSMLLFVGISVAVFALMALFFGHNLRRINTAMNTTRTRGSFRMRGLSTSSPLRALYRREMKFYLSCPVYLMNTAFSLLMALFGLVILAVKAGDLLPMLLELLPTLGVSKDQVCTLGGLLIAMFTGMCCTTSASISLEGKQLWLIKSLPVDGWQVLLSKLMVNWTLVLPASVIFSVVLCALLSFPAQGTLLALLLPLLLSLLFPILGLMINLKLHSFDWTNETAVVKQSASVSIAVFMGMLAPIGLAVAFFLLREHMLTVAWLSAALLAIANLALLVLLKKRANHMIHRL